MSTLFMFTLLFRRAIDCQINSRLDLCYLTIFKMGILKKTTGLTGLAVAANPHHTLGALYGKILRTLKKMPESSMYRQYTEQIVRERAAVLTSTKKVYEIEQKINCGQAEELIIQAENELNLARKMLNWKPWEPLVAKPPKTQWDWPPTK